MPTYGLIGYPLSHSFSRTYFTEKFRKAGMEATHRYLNFEIEDVEALREVLGTHPELRGINVTIPHKQAVVGLLDELDPAAARIGAVNTILIRDGSTKGYNTDYVGFRDDLLEKLTESESIPNLREAGALILGTGGASLAVREALASLGVRSRFVSRSPGGDRLTYNRVDRRVLNTHHLIVNTTPLGMDPHPEAAPELPYQDLSPDHFCYDLIYNPSETRFMRLAREQGAQAANGLGMLHKQAEAAWDIWNDNNSDIPG